MSFETSFESKQPKLEPKLVLALSEQNVCFGLFGFYTETERFVVSIEPKQTEEQPEQCDREKLKQTETNPKTKILDLFQFVSVCFGVSNLYPNN